MKRILAGTLLALATCCAYAQTAEVPAEKADMTTVVIFVVVFVASCAGFIGYAWWTGKKKRANNE